MPTIIVTTRAGQVHEIDAKVNATLMETIRGAGLDELEALCGGCLACGTCHVYIAEGDIAKLPAQSDDEIAMLSNSGHLTSHSRLSCQIRVTDAFSGLALTIAPEDE